MQIAANLSMLFSELPMAERIGAAASAGFEAVEIQFPYEVDLGDLVAARDRTGVDFVLANIPAGDLENGDVGLTCLAGRQDEYAAAVDTCLTYARGLGARRINSLAGRPLAEAEAEATAILIDNLRYASGRFAEIGATVLLEPVNPFDVPGYLIDGLDTGLEVVRAVDRENVKLLFDFYHISQTEPSLADAVVRAGDSIGHVQFADVPGRHEPGTGGVDFEGGLRALRDIGYTGYVSAEYWPLNKTEDGLEWRDRFETWMKQH